MAQPLTLTGIEGSLCYSEENGRVRFDCSCSNPGDGLYKLWLYGEKGSFLLGTLCPRENGLGLEQTISQARLRQCGCWPPERGGAVRAFAFSERQAMPQSQWQRMEHPETLLRDHILIHSAKKAGSALFRRREYGFQLAFPWQVDQPFPMIPLFCLCRVQSWAGRQYAVFSFDQKGTPFLQKNK